MARAHKTDCKGTAFFWNTQIFSEKTAFFMHFYSDARLEGTSSNHTRGSYRSISGFNGVRGRRGVTGVTAVTRATEADCAAYSGGR